MFFVYLIRCKGDKLYTGFTNNIIRRFNEHRNGTGAKFTKYNPPIELIYFEMFDVRKDAMRREREIKKFPRKKKLKLWEVFQKEHHIGESTSFSKQE